MASTATAVAPSAWAPLHVRAFRMLWIAQLSSMIGTWMQTVGAQWLLVDEPNAATLVALVQTAAMVPTLVLALPAGVLADILDRRRLLVGVQLFQLLVGAVLVALTLADRLPPTTLLLLTFLIGCGQTLTVPGYQALVQDLVPREQLRQAAALNGVAMNLARAVGPAVAGLIIARTGVAAVFALNALTFLVMALVLARVAPRRDEERVLPERFTGALVAGGRFVRHSPVFRRILLRVVLFVVPGAALWALLPLVASQVLGLDATGYGLLLAALGVGAVSGAVLLPRLTARFAPNRLVMLAGLVFGASTALSVLVPSLPFVLVALVPAGLAWLAMLATMNGTLQVFLPGWVRARGLSMYQMVFAGGQAIASVCWGLLAQWAGVVPALLVAGALLAAGAVTVFVWPVHDPSGLDQRPSLAWPEPIVEFEPELEGGPVVVTLTYRVAPERAPEFVQAYERVRRIRLRTGAQASHLYRDGAAPERFVEVSMYPSWAEHLRQHGGRLTKADRERELEAIALAEGRPEVQHLFPAHATVTALNE
jgi:MFS family permease